MDLFKAVGLHAKLLSKDKNIPNFDQFYQELPKNLEKYHTLYNLNEKPENQLSAEQFNTHIGSVYGISEEEIKENRALAEKEKKAEEWDKDGSRWDNLFEHIGATVAKSFISNLGEQPGYVGAVAVAKAKELYTLANPDFSKGTNDWYADPETGKLEEKTQFQSDLDEIHRIQNAMPKAISDVRKGEAKGTFSGVINPVMNWIEEAQVEAWMDNPIHKIFEGTTDAVMQMLPAFTGNPATTAAGKMGLFQILTATMGSVNQAGNQMLSAVEWGEQRDARIEEYKKMGIDVEGLVDKKTGKSLTFNQMMLHGYAGLGVGLLEYVTMSRLFGRMGTPTYNAAGERIIQYADDVTPYNKLYVDSFLGKKVQDAFTKVGLSPKNAGRIAQLMESSAEEGLEEVLQQFAENLSAAAIYKGTNNLIDSTLEGTGEAGLYGAVVGGILHIGMKALRLKGNNAETLNDRDHAILAEEALRQRNIQISLDQAQALSEIQRGAEGQLSPETRNEWSNIIATTVRGSSITRVFQNEIESLMQKDTSTESDDVKRQVAEERLILILEDAFNGKYSSDIFDGADGKAKFFSMMTPIVNARANQLTVSNTRTATPPQATAQPQNQQPVNTQVQSQSATTQTITPAQNNQAARQHDPNDLFAGAVPVGDHIIANAIADGETFVPTDEDATEKDAAENDTKEQVTDIESKKYDTIQRMEDELKKRINVSDMNATEGIVESPAGKFGVVENGQRVWFDTLQEAEEKIRDKYRTEIEVDRLDSEWHRISREIRTVEDEISSDNVEATKFTEGKKKIDELLAERTQIESQIKNIMSGAEANLKASEKTKEEETEQTKESDKPETEDELWEKAKKEGEKYPPNKKEPNTEQDLFAGAVPTGDHTTEADVTSTKKKRGRPRKEKEPEAKVEKIDDVKVGTNNIKELEEERKNDEITIKKMKEALGLKFDGKTAGTNASDNISNIDADINKIEQAISKFKKFLKDNPGTNRTEEINKKILLLENESEKLYAWKSQYSPESNTNPDVKFDEHGYVIEEMYKVEDGKPNTPTNTTAITAETLELFANNVRKNDIVYDFIYQKLKKIGKKPDLKVLRNGEKIPGTEKFLTSPGVIVHKDGKSTIYINEDALNKPGKLRRTIIHETTHYLIASSLDPKSEFYDKDFAKDVDDILNLAKERFDEISKDMDPIVAKEIAYYLNNTKELIAGLYESVNLRAFLKGSPLPKGNLLSRFYQKVINAFKRMGAETNLLNLLEVRMYDMYGVPAEVLGYQTNIEAITLEDYKNSLELQQLDEGIINELEQDLTFAAVADKLRVAKTNDPTALYKLTTMTKGEFQTALNNIPFIAEIIKHKWEQEAKAEGYTLEDYNNMYSNWLYNRIKSFGLMTQVRLVAKRINGKIQHEAITLPMNYIDYNDTEKSSLIQKTKIQEYLNLASKVIEEKTGIKVNLTAVEIESYQDMTGNSQKLTKLQYENEVWEENLREAGYVFLGTFADKGKAIAVKLGNPMLDENGKQIIVDGKRQYDKTLETALIKMAGDYKNAITELHNQIIKYEVLSKLPDVTPANLKREIEAMKNVSLEQFINAIVEDADYDEKTKNEAITNFQDAMKEWEHFNMEGVTMGTPSYPTLGVILRLIETDIKNGGFSEAHPESVMFKFHVNEKGKLKTDTYDAIKILKRPQEVAETYHVEVTPHLINKFFTSDDIKDAETGEYNNGMKLKKGKVSVNSVIFDGKKDLNVLGTPLTDGVTYYLLEENSFNTFYRAAHGIVRRGALKFWGSHNVNSRSNNRNNLPFFLKTSGQGISPKSPLGKWMKSNNIGLLISSESAKVNGILGTNITRPVVNLDMNNAGDPNYKMTDEIFDIPLEEIHRIMEKGEDKEEAKGILQAITANLGCKGNKAFEETLKNYSPDVYEHFLDGMFRQQGELIDRLLAYSPDEFFQYIKNITAETDNPVAIKIASMFSPIMKSNLTSEIARLKKLELSTTDEVAREEIKAEIKAKRELLSKRDFVASYAAENMLRHPSARKILHDYYVSNLTNIKKFEMPGTYVTLRPNLGKATGDSEIVEKTIERTVFSENEKALKQFIRMTENDNTKTTKEKKDLIIAEKKRLKDGTAARKTELLDECLDANGRLKKGYCIISKRDAKSFGIKPGDSIIFNFVPSNTMVSLSGQKVVGIGTEEQMDVGSVIMNSEYAQTLCGKDFDIDTALMLPYNPDMWSRSKYNEMCSFLNDMIDNYTVMMEEELRKHIPANEILEEEDGIKKSPIYIKANTTKLIQKIFKPVKSRRVENMFSNDILKTLNYFQKKVGEPITQRKRIQLLIESGFRSEFRFEESGKKIKVDPLNGDTFLAHYILGILTDDKVDMPTNTESFKYSYEPKDLTALIFGFGTKEKITAKEIKEYHKAIDAVSKILFGNLIGFENTSGYDKAKDKWVAMTGLIKQQQQINEAISQIKNTPAENRAPLIEEFVQYVFKGDVEKMTSLEANLIRNMDYDAINVNYQPGKSIPAMQRLINMVDADKLHNFNASPTEIEAMEMEALKEVYIPNYVADAKKEVAKLPPGVKKMKQPKDESTIYNMSWRHFMTGKWFLGGEKVIKLKSIVNQMVNFQEKDVLDSGRKIHLEILDEIDKLPKFYKDNHPHNIHKKTRPIVISEAMKIMMDKKAIDVIPDINTPKSYKTTFTINNIKKEIEFALNGLTLEINGISLNAIKSQNKELYGILTNPEFWNSKNISALTSMVNLNSPSTLPTGLKISMIKKMIEKEFEGFTNNEKAYFWLGEMGFDENVGTQFSLASVGLTNISIANSFQRDLKTSVLTELMSGFNDDTTQALYLKYINAVAKTTNPIPISKQKGVTAIKSNDDTIIEYMYDENGIESEYGDLNNSNIKEKLLNLESLDEEYGKASGQFIEAGNVVGVVPNVTNRAVPSAFTAEDIQKYLGIIRPTTIIGSTMYQLLRVREEVNKIEQIQANVINDVTNTVDQLVNTTKINKQRQLHAINKTIHRIVRKNLTGIVGIEKNSSGQIIYKVKSGKHTKEFTDLVEVARFAKNRHPELFKGLGEEFGPNNAETLFIAAAKLQKLYGYDTIEIVSSIHDYFTQIDSLSSDVKVRAIIKKMQSEYENILLRMRKTDFGYIPTYYDPATYENVVKAFILKGKKTEVKKRIVIEERKKRAAEKQGRTLVSWDPEYIGKSRDQEFIERKARELVNASKKSLNHQVGQGDSSFLQKTLRNVKDEIPNMDYTTEIHTMHANNLTKKIKSDLYTVIGLQFDAEATRLRIPKAMAQAVRYKIATTSNSKIFNSVRIKVSDIQPGMEIGYWHSALNIHTGQYEDVYITSATVRKVDNNYVYFQVDEIKQKDEIDKNIQRVSVLMNKEGTESRRFIQTQLRKLKEEGYITEQQINSANSSAAKKDLVLSGLYSKLNNPDKWGMVSKSRMLIHSTEENNHTVNGAYHYKPFGILRDTKTERRESSNRTGEEVEQSKVADALSSALESAPVVGYLSGIKPGMRNMARAVFALVIDDPFGSIGFMTRRLRAKFKGKIYDNQPDLGSGRMKSIEEAIRTQDFDKFLRKAEKEIKDSPAYIENMKRHFMLNSIFSEGLFNDATLMHIVADNMQLDTLINNGSVTSTIYLLSKVLHSKAGYDTYIKRRTDLMQRYYETPNVRAAQIILDEVDSLDRAYAHEAKIVPKLARPEVKKEIERLLEPLTDETRGEAKLNRIIDELNITKAEARRLLADLTGKTTVKAIMTPFKIAEEKARLLSIAMKVDNMVHNGFVGIENTDAIDQAVKETIKNTQGRYDEIWRRVGDEGRSGHRIWLKFGHYNYLNWRNFKSLLSKANEQAHSHKEFFELATKGFFSTEKITQEECVRRNLIKKINKLGYDINTVPANIKQRINDEYLAEQSALRVKDWETNYPAKILRGFMAQCWIRTLRYSMMGLAVDAFPVYDFIAESIVYILRFITGDLEEEELKKYDTQQYIGSLFQFCVGIGVTMPLQMFGNVMMDNWQVDPTSVKADTYDPTPTAIRTAVGVGAFLIDTFAGGDEDNPYMTNQRNDRKFITELLGFYPGTVYSKDKAKAEFMNKSIWGKGFDMINPSAFVPFLRDMNYEGIINTGFVGGAF